MLPCRFILVLAIVGCASADPVVHVDAGSDADASRSDAAGASADAPISGSCATPYTGVLASWVLTAEAGTQTSTAASGVASGVTAGPLSRSASLTAVSGASSMNSSNWPVAAALDATKYYTFSITPPSGCTLSLTSLAIDAKASSTGPAQGALATSKDTYAATTPVSTSTAGTITLNITNATTTVELRVYGYAASSTAGTLRVQNTLSVSGKLE